MRRPFFVNFIKKSMFEDIAMNYKKQIIIILVGMGLSKIDPIQYL